MFKIVEKKSLNPTVSKITVCLLYTSDAADD